METEIITITYQLYLGPDSELIKVVETNPYPGDVQLVTDLVAQLAQRELGQENKIIDAQS